MPNALLDFSMQQCAPSYKGGCNVRIALFSDVHGNLAALEAILNELDRRGPFDKTVCAGDLVYLGPSPEEVVECLQQSDIVCLRGNCEGMVTGQIEVGRRRRKGPRREPRGTRPTEKREHPTAPASVGRLLPHPHLA